MSYGGKSPGTMFISVLLAVAVIGAVVLLGGCLSDSKADVTYQNDNLGFALQAPKVFMDAVQINEGDDGVLFVDKEIQAALPEHVLGVVGRIEAYDKREFSQDVIQAHAEMYGLRYLGENENYYFGYAHATDVQVPPDASQELSDRFRALEDQFDEVIKTFQITGPGAAPSQAEIAERFVRDQGYTILVNSGANFDLQLPASFDDKVNGADIGALLKDRNELSKQYGLDFSDYMGQKVTLITYAGEGKDGVIVNLDLILAGARIVGFWIDDGDEWPDFNTIVNAYQSDLENASYLSFIKDFNRDTRMLTFDKIEWVTQKDTKRVSELGLDANLDFPNGYYIYNESQEYDRLKVAGEVTVWLVDWNDLAQPSLTDMDGLLARMAEYPAPYHLKVGNGEIIEIIEQYRP